MGVPIFSVFGSWIAVAWEIDVTVVILLPVKHGKDEGAKIVSLVVGTIGIVIQFRSFGASVACTEIVCLAGHDA